VKRHDADAVSLVFALIFLGLAAGWSLTKANLVEIADLQLAGPILLVAAGAIGLVVSLRRGRRERTGEPGESADETEQTVVLDRPDND
jgi:membrane protein implicated in regulation of membrane protease activity